MPARGVDLEAIRDSIRERYRQKVVARTPNDEASAVALVMIDTLLEMMLEVLGEYDRRIREESEAARAVH